MRGTLLAMAVLALTGCGDPATNDDRGYTKAPLEGPGLWIEGEPEPALTAVRGKLEPGLTGAPPAAVQDTGG